MLISNSGTIIFCKKNVIKLEGINTGILTRTMSLLNLLNLDTMHSVTEDPYIPYFILSAPARAGISILIS